MYKVLLVENDPADQLFLKKAFERFKEQLDISTVRDGSEALAHLKHNGSPSIILLDLNMPGMNGRELLDRLRADDELKLVPSIVLSTSDDAADIRSCYERNASAYLVKPETPEDYRRIAGRIYDFWIEEVKLPEQGH